MLYTKNINPNLRHCIYLLLYASHSINGIIQSCANYIIILLLRKYGNISIITVY